MKISNKTIVVSIVVVLFCGIFIFDSLGLWKTESTKIPQKISQGEFAGEYNPEDIRGSYSFKDIENAFGVKSETIARAFNLDAVNPGGIKAKDLETVYDYFEGDMEIGTGSIKLFISLYTGLPYSEVDYLPTTAVEVLKEEGKWSDDLENLISNYIVDVGDELSVLESSTQTEGNEGNSTDHEETMEVKGKTTFADIIGWGVEKERIEEILGFEIGNVNMNIRDACEDNGVSFGEAKSRLNELLE